MSLISQLAPNFTIHSPLHSCSKCVQFPLVKPSRITADLLAHIKANKPLDQLPDTQALTQAIHHHLSSYLKANIQPLPTASAIKATIPILSPGGGGKIFDKEAKEKLEAEVPIYQCNTCRAVYLLPQDYKDAGRKIYMPLFGVERMTDERVRKDILNAMQDMYTRMQDDPSQGPSNFKVEVYCFETFVVMDKWTGPKDECELICAEVLRGCVTLT